MILNNGTITATNRPDFQWDINHTITRDKRKFSKLPVPNNYGIDMDWHHIIPWNVLRNGWSALASSNRWEVLKVWVQMWKFTPVQVPIIMHGMKNGVLANAFVGDMYHNLCWSKWNLVEGPTNGNRAPGDDPGGDGLDAFSSINASSNLRTRSLILGSIYSIFHNWGASKNNITADEEKVLLKEFNKLKKFKNSQIVLFDPQMWKLVTKGKINKFGLAVGGKHPTWEKNKEMP